MSDETDWSDTESPEPTPADYRELQAQYDQLQTELKNARDEAHHWRCKYEHQVLKARLLCECPGMPVERIQAYTLVQELEAKVADQRKRLDEQSELNSRVLNERVDVENILQDIATGKRTLPNRRDCQVLQIMLGVPRKHRSDVIKNHVWNSVPDKE